MKKTLTALVASAALAGPLSAQQRQPLPVDSVQQVTAGVKRVLSVLSPAPDLETEKRTGGTRQTYKLVPKSYIARMAETNRWYQDVQDGIKAAKTDVALVVQGTYEGREFMAIDLGANGHAEFGILLSPKPVGFAVTPAEQEFIRRAYWNAVARF